MKLSMANDLFGVYMNIYFWIFIHLTICAPRRTACNGFTMYYLFQRQYLTIRKNQHIFCAKFLTNKAFPTNFFPKKNTFSSMKKAVVQLLSWILILLIRYICPYKIYLIVSMISWRRLQIIIIMKIIIILRTSSA